MKSTTSSRNIEVVKSPPTCLYILVMVMWIYDHLRREILRSEVLRWPGSQMLEREHELWLTRLTPENSETKLTPENSAYRDQIETRDTTLCKVVQSFTYVPDNSQQLSVYIWNRKRVGWYFTQDKDVPHRTHAEALCRLYRAFEDSQGPFKTSSTPHSVTFDLILFNKYLWFDPLQLGHLTQHHER